MPFVMWEEYEIGKGVESKERKKSSDTGRRENSEMDSRR